MARRFSAIERACHKVAAVVLRNIIGFLVQVLPCAVLCVAPFTRRLDLPLRQLVAMLGVAICVALVPFVYVATGPLPDVLDPWRLTLQNAVFLTLACALVALMFSHVDAPASQKAFVILMVGSLAYFVTQAAALIGDNVWTTGHDGYMYPFRTLVLLSLSNTVFLALALPLARYVRKLLDTLVDPALWWGLSLLPACLLVTMMFGNWLPLTFMSYSEVYLVLVSALTVFALFLFWWVLRIAETVHEDSQRRTQLVTALDEHKHTQAELEQQLVLAHARVDELERGLDTRSETADGVPNDIMESSFAGTSLQGVWKDQVITIGGPRTALSFLAGDLLFAESQNRSRLLHLADGTTLPCDMALSQLAGLLPEGHFTFCHRATLVNLHHVAQVAQDRITLDNGTVLPMSRRRSSEFTAQLETIRHNR